MGAWACRHGRMGTWARAFNRDWRELQGENEGKTFLHFLLKSGRIVPIYRVWAKIPYRSGSSHSHAGISSHCLNSSSPFGKR